MKVKVPKSRPVGPHVICAPTMTSVAGTTPNMTPEDNSINPHECHFFSYQVSKTEAPADGKVIIEGWKMSGEIPLDLSISSSGMISGTIKIFNDQPSLQDCINSKADKVKLSGENWQEVGRPTKDYYEFNFEVWVEYTFITKEGVPIQYMSAPTNVCVKAIKSHSIDGYLAMRNYLKSGSSTISTDNGDVEIEHRYDIGGKKYSYNEFEEFLDDSPGPWPICGRDL